MSAQSAVETKIPQTLMFLCPVCGCDTGEPLGVTGSFDGTSDGIVVIRCADCTAVYLAPSQDGLRPLPPLVADSALRHQLRRVMTGKPAGAKVLLVGGAGGAGVEARVRDALPGCTIQVADGSSHPGTSGVLQGASYDLVVLPHTLEAAPDPIGLLRQLSKMLKDNGRLLVIVSNIDSVSFRWFGGRHWSGFRYPATRQHFGSTALRRLAVNVGLAVRETWTVGGPGSLLASVRNWLGDWGFSRFSVSLLAGDWLLPKFLAYVVEAIPSARGKGHLLVTVLDTSDNRKSEIA